MGLYICVCMYEFIYVYICMILYMHVCLYWYECVHVFGVFFYVYVYDCLCFCNYKCMYVDVYICMHVCMYIYGWFHFSQNYAFFFFLNFLIEQFQQFTGMRHSKVCTSASTFFLHSQLYLQCLFNLLVNIFND